MIKEVLVVEGKSDVLAVRRAVEADCIITEGFNLKPRALADIRAAYERRGIIILTDPDSAGERIRTYLTRRFPEAKHAFVPKEDATAKGDIGIEQASPAAIRAALDKVRGAEWNPQPIFDAGELLRLRLSGAGNASARRAKLGAALGVGYANAKTFLTRLNTYGVTREEFEAALAALDAVSAEGNEEA